MTVLDVMPHDLNLVCRTYIWKETIDSQELSFGAVACIRYTHTLTKGRFIKVLFLACSEWIPVIAYYISEVIFPFTVCSGLSENGSFPLAQREW